jgi:hypothetical protein
MIFTFLDGENDLVAWIDEKRLIGRFDLPNSDILLYIADMCCYLIYENPPKPLKSSR